MKILVFLFIVGSLANVSFIKTAEAEALTAAQKAKLAEWQKEVDDVNATTGYYPKEMCGFPMKLKMDESLVKPFMEANSEAHFYCIAIRDKLSTICRNAKDNLKMGNHKDNKQLVAKLVKGKTIVCKASKTGEDKSEFVPGAKDFVAYIGAKADVSEQLYQYLTTKMGFNDGEPPADAK